MFQRDEIPAWLAVDWWVLLIVSFVVHELSNFQKHPRVDSSVAEAGSWFFTAWQLLQVLWLRRQTGKSEALVLLVASSGFDILVYLCETFLAGPIPRLSNILSVSCFIGSIATSIWAAFVFRANFEEYSEREGYGRVLSKWMTLFFSIYYFQYHLHVLADDLASRLRLQQAEAPEPPSGAEAP